MTTRRQWTVSAALAAVAGLTIWLIVRARDDDAEYRNLSADEILSRVQRDVVQGAIAAITGHNLSCCRNGAAS